MASTDDRIYLYDEASSSWVEVTSLRTKTVFQDKGTQATDKVTAFFERAITSQDYNPTWNQELRLQVDGTYIFGGRIRQVRNEPSYIVVEAYSYGTSFLDVYVNEVYEDMLLEDIVEDLINTYTDLTWVPPAESTGITVDKIVFKDKRLAEALNTIVVEVLGYVFTTDYEKNATIERRGNTSSGETLTVDPAGDGNVYERPGWQQDPDFVVKKVIIEGDKQTFEHQDTFTPDGTTTTFSLTYTPIGSVKVAIDGTSKDPKVEGAKSGDYTVDSDAKEIVFETAPSGSNGTIDYTYSIPIRIEAGSGTPERKISNKSIKRFSEARKYAQEYLKIHAEASKKATLKTKKYYPAVRAGRTVEVVDDYEGITGEFVVQSVTYAYPDLTAKVKVGTQQTLIYDWQKEVIERIRQLEQQDSSADIVQLYEKVSTDLEVTLKPELQFYERDVHDTRFWGDGGNWNDGNWGDRREGDVFHNYTGGVYSEGDVWTLTNGATIDDDEYELDLPSTGTSAEFHYTMNSDLTDKTGTNPDGTAEGGATLNTSTPLVGAGSYDLDGTDGAINLGAPSSLKPTDDLEFDIQIRRDTTGAETIISTGLDRAAGYEVYVNATDQLVFGAYIGGTWTEITGTTALTTGTQYSVRFKYQDGDGMRLYLDGTEEANNTSVSGTISYDSENIYVGARRTSS